MANETVTYSLEAVLTRIEGKIDSLEKRIDERFDKVDERFDKIEERLTKVEIGQVELKGEIKALDERLTTEIKGLTARVAYQEFTNRGILIALIVVILGGAAKLFGFFPNP
ncbi:DUF4164 domain-containing protein [Microcystis sp. LEGE 00066]|uniref:Genome sequencing data, contig C319 n=2 Tax=Microcystis aeruginosa (strain PCC 7806) TaxID=267872 RepID=A8YJ24_MICA7|nr:MULTISPECIES: DUF4164 family protein [Microcystis]TRU04239.1 MAG: DUF4164 domain-containing protein [Microcystis aeruginosa Ma_AC_P_19900807_S300]ARI83160.1 hypothetical protein BH695_3881 [Microcystis aeruginosa PCC 7806SL]ELS45836.1 hypothetical protein C789_4357 [Microcystis aeruginosa FACHB-905 = DIANCHI905]MBE9261685.1 DUF4164 domain-containing protein [Microcystis sp. LEGE 00066]UGS10107.1 DUF4164 domain-containing protein [Microcystis aeruginosa FACHB-905 = DIANCHI905]